LRVRIAKRVVDALAAGDLVADDEIRGFVARRLKSGIVTYGYRYREKTTRRQHWIGLGLHGAITPDEARRLAKQRAREVAAGRDPTAENQIARAAAANTVNAVLDNFVVRHVRKVGLRSAATIERTFDRCVRPHIGTRSIYELSRKDVVGMLDAIEDKSGPVMADRTLAYVRKAFNWQAARDDQFAPPIVKGMARTRPRDRARTRVLSDEEVRDVWTALDQLKNLAPDCYPAFVRTLLLTAQRRSDVAFARWEEIEGDVWTIPGQRYKTGLPQVVPLTERVRRLFGRARKSGYIFSSDRGKTAFSGYSKAKRALDRKIDELRKAARRGSMDHWTLHDLRRTARSLMSQAGVPSEHAERVLGHTIPGVRHVYDRHAYVAEKWEGLIRLSKQIDITLDQSTEGIAALPRNSEVIGR
jgi:integrase